MSASRSSSSCWASTRRSAACCCARCSRRPPQHAARPARLRDRAALAARPRCPTTRAGAAAGAPTPTQRPVARSAEPAHDRSRPRPPPADQPAARLRVALLGGIALRALRDRLLPALVPAGPVRRPVPRRGQRQPGPPRCAIQAPRGDDRRPQRPTLVDEPPGHRRPARPRAARRRARGRATLGPADDACAARPKGHAASPPPMPHVADPDLGRLRRLGGVLGTPPHDPASG